MAKKLKFKCPEGCAGAHIEQQALGAVTVTPVTGLDADGEFAYGPAVVMDTDDSGYQYMCSVCGRVFACSEAELMDVADEEGWLK